MKHIHALGIGFGFLLASSGGATAVTVTNVATADTHVRIGSPTSTYGSSSPLYAGDYVSPNTAYRTMLQFDVSSIPSGMVLSAILRLQNANVGVINGQAYGYVFRLTNSWSETQASWNNRLTGTPWSAAGGDFDGSVTNATVLFKPYAAISNSVYDMNVTALVRGWVDGAYPNDGLVIVSPLEGSNTFRLFGFESRESTTSGAVLPSLVIVYDIPEPSTLALGLLAIGFAWIRRRGACR